MTRDELFERYVADTLDEEATAELGTLFAEDPEFAAQFAKDLVATGKFKEVGSELQRIEPKRPKLIMGTAAELPKALQFLGVGEKPPPGFYDKPAEAEADSEPALESEPEAEAEPVEVPPPAQTEVISQPTAGEAEAVGEEVESVGHEEHAPGQEEESVDAEAEGAVDAEREEVGIPGTDEGAAPELADQAGGHMEGADELEGDYELEVEAKLKEDAGEEVSDLAEEGEGDNGEDRDDLVEVGSGEGVPPVAARQPPPPPPPAGPPPTISLQGVVASGAPPAPEHYAQAAPVDMFGAPGAVPGHHGQGQRVLRSATRSSPTFFIAIAAILVIGIGVALFIGLNRKPVGPPSGESVIAKVDFVEGEVVFTREVGETKLEQGADLEAGDRIKVGQGSVRIAYVGEKTYLHVRAGSEITFGDHKAGKQVRLSMGEMTVEAGPQPIGKPMVIQSDNARATLLGTKVTMRSLAKETLVEVSQGSVKVERLRDGISVQLGSGAWTLVGDAEPPLAWEFAAGVNLNGEEVDVEGRKWMSDAAARSAGLKVEAVDEDPEMRTSVQQPLGYVPNGIRSVLLSNVAASKSKLAIKWPQPNARYQVFVWMMEEEGNEVRSLRLNVEEKLVADDLGKEQSLGQWDRFGPYQADVKDGVLDLLVSADSKFENHDPHLSGIAIYRLGPGGAPAPASPTNPAPGAPSNPVAPAVPPAPGTPPAIAPTIPE